MKTIKTIFIITTITVLLISCKEQPKEKEINKTEKADLSKEKEVVLSVMKAYKDAIQNLTTEGTFELFTQNATIFEQGKVEGTYKDYIDHHLGPE